MKKITNENCFLSSNISALEKDLKVLKSSIGEKEHASEAVRQKFEAELAKKEKEWTNLHDEKEDELRELAQKFEELIMIYKGNKQDLAEANEKLKNSEDVIQNYKTLIDTLNIAKEKAIGELEKTEEKLHEAKQNANV